MLQISRLAEKNLHPIPTPLQLLLQHARNSLRLAPTSDRIREDQHLLARHATTPKLPLARQLNSCSKCWHVTDLLNKISPSLRQGGPCWIFVPILSAWGCASCG